MMIDRKGWIILAGLLAFLCLMDGPAYSSLVTPDLERVLSSTPPGREVSVIVTLKEKADLHRMTKSGTAVSSRRFFRRQLVETLKSVADRAQKPLKTLLTERGVSRLSSLVLANGLAFSAPPDVVRHVAAQPGVERVSVDTRVAIPPVTRVLAGVAEWNVHAVRAPELWDSGYTGQGVVVATMDTGVDMLHPDLAGSWRGGINSWYDPSGQHPTPYDADGHGTGTMGVIVGGSSGGTNIGIAPGTQWIAVKIFNDAGEGFVSTIHQGFDWLLDPDGDPATDDAPDVVNNSWGLLDYTVNQCIEEFSADVLALKAAGIAVVFAAGNNGPRSSSSVSPANYPGALAVGATDASNVIAPWSSRGPSACGGSLYPEVVAPGVSIKTADLTFGSAFPGAYVHVSGTSFSAPHVSGIMALLMSAFPEATLPQLEEALKYTAFDLGPVGSDNAYGYGLVNASAAFLALGGATLVESVIVTSFPALDGWVGESVGGSGVGGRARRGLVRVGDDRRNRQLKGIVSFDTSKIPVDAQILSATLRLTRKGVVKADPSPSFGSLSVDVMRGTHKRKRPLKSDFEEPAAAPQAAEMSELGPSMGILTGSLSTDGLNAINRDGATRMRLSFPRSTDGDRTADSTIFYSGRARFKEKRPSLEITYLP